MCQSALALLAAGAQDPPLRGLMFLAASQLKDGRFPQKFFINGDPWFDDAKQLDEYSFPIMLAYHLREAGLLQQFDPSGMVLAAAGALIGTPRFFRAMFCLFLATVCSRSSDLRTCSTVT
jgi:glucoamylase